MAIKTTRNKASAPKEDIKRQRIRSVCLAGRTKGGHSIWLVHEIFKSCVENRKFKAKPRFQQATWNDTAALDNQFSFGPEKERSDFQHPVGSRQTQMHAASLPQKSHHFSIGNRIWRRHVNGSGKLVVGDYPLDSPAVIRNVDPGDILLAASHLSSKSKPYQTPQHRENAVPARAQNQRHAHGNFARPGRRRFLQSGFPGFCDFDGKCVFCFRCGLHRTRFVPRLTKCVLINGRRAGIQPNRRRGGAPANRFTEDTR